MSDGGAGRRRSWWIQRVLCCWLPMTVLWSCSRAISIDSLSPRPEVHLPWQGRSLCLLLDPAIPDRYSIEPGQDAPKVIIERWRHALLQAFASGLGKSFDIQEARAEICLRLVRVSLTFTHEPRTKAAIVLAKGPGSGAPIILAHGGPSHAGAGVRPHRRAIHAQIAYTAELMDAQGRALRHVTGVVTAHRSGDRSSESMVRSIEEAIQAMYEEIAAQLFGEGFASNTVAGTSWLGLERLVAVASASS